MRDVHLLDPARSIDVFLNILRVSTGSIEENLRNLHAPIIDASELFSNESVVRFVLVAQTLNVVKDLLDFFDVLSDNPEFFLGVA